MTADDVVLVTGGSGFLGVHCVLRLLQAGYRVRTTVRSPLREPKVRAMLAEGGVTAGEALSFAVADLKKDAGWAEAVDGCRYVLHVASPFPLRAPKDENELIAPAREGTLRVLRAARDAGVKRVVLTSSAAAILYGHPPQAAPFDETGWTEVEAGPDEVTAYAKSKTLAERAAWDFVAAEGGKLELSVVNPVGIFGPVLGSDYSSSIVFVQRLLDGAVPGLPRIAFGVVDVRDVADLQFKSMTDPAAKGERFLAVAGHFLTARHLAETLKSRMGAAGKRVPVRQLPDWCIRIFARFDRDVALVLPELGKKLDATSAKAQRVLGWQPRSAEEAIVATGESLLRLGLLKSGRK